MVDLTMEQGTRAVEHFLYHKYTNDEVSRLMNLSLRISQLESGQTEPLSMSPKIPVPYSSKTWWVGNKHAILYGKKWAKN